MFWQHLLFPEFGCLCTGPIFAVQRRTMTGGIAVAKWLMTVQIHSGSLSMKTSMAILPTAILHCRCTWVLTYRGSLRCMKILTRRCRRCSLAQAWLVRLCIQMSQNRSGPGVVVYRGIICVRNVKRYFFLDRK